MKATATPWTAHEIARPDGRYILIESGDRLIATVLIEDDEDQANAELIVEAVNRHRSRGNPS